MVLLEYINQSILFPNNLSYYASIMFDAFDASIIGQGLLYIVIMYNDVGDIPLWNNTLLYYVYVTGLGKTNHNVTFCVSRNTVLKH